MEEELSVSLHKTGSRLECQDYHGISLLSVPGKGKYARVLDERVKRQISGRILELQAGRGKKLH